MVLHLAFTDLMVCFTNLPNYFIKHGGAVFHFKYAFDVVGCDVMWYLTFFSIYNGWLAQGVIAVIRALSMISPRAEKLLRKKWIFLIIIPGMYIFSALMAIPFFKEVGTYVSRKYKNIVSLRSHNIMVLLVLMLYLQFRYT